MVIAADSARAAVAIEPSPSGASLRGLDGVNLLLAGALSGFGPYVAAFLADQNWTQQRIGLVLTAGRFAGLLSQLPGGALLDAIRSKRIAVAVGAGMVAAGALIIAVWPSFPLVLAALVLQGITGGFLGLAIATISLGLVGHVALAERLGRNQRFASMGGVFAAGIMGFIAYFLSYRAIFIAAAALVLPLLFALGRIQPSDIHFGRASCIPDHQGPSAPPRARLRSLWKTPGLLIFAGCVFLFQMANASLLPLAGEAFAYSKEALSSLIVSALIMVPQVIVAIMAPWTRRQANMRGRRAAAARRIRGTADPCAGVCLDYQSNDSHRRSIAGRSQRSDAGRAHGADSRRPHSGYRPIQSRAGIRRNDIRDRRFAPYHTIRSRCRELRPRGRISGHRSSGPGRSCSPVVANA